VNLTHSHDDGSRRAAAGDEAAAYLALSRIALADRPIEESLEDVAVLAKRALPEIPEASVTLLTKDQARTAAFSGKLALQLDERQYDAGYGPCMDAAVSGGAIGVVIDDPDSPYPDFRRAAHQLGVTHSLSVGLPAAGRIIGALNLYTKAGQPFGDDSTRIAGTFAGFTGILLSTLGRHDDTAAAAGQLQQALQSRAVISQAQGILMEQHHCNRDEAFAALIRLSQQQGAKLLEVAQALLDRTASS
jgi:GAF domain-containing protein